ncbi:hypothetical protein ABT324_10830 [Saccharopolyspora sp. NPDC000359]|uniref:hypothetical protein n=1 Tax=Saccharopolyspora sp. NPDC000359 TaxID=3154251 RepID=UPI003322BFC0
MHDPGRPPEHVPDGPPADRRRGAHLETLPEERVTRNAKGLITHVKNAGGKYVPVKEYVQELSARRAQVIATGTGKKDGPCSAAAIDLRTGTITEGVNGRPNDLVKPEDVHPVLRKNLEDLGHWQYPVKESETTLYQWQGADLVQDGRAHHDDPLRHAEVKATKELLWERERLAREAGGAPPTGEALAEMRIDPRWIGKGSALGVGGPAAACANCDTVLRGVPSYSGRFSYSPRDYRYPDNKHSFETDAGL